MQRTTKSQDKTADTFIRRLTPNTAVSSSYHGHLLPHDSRGQPDQEHIVEFPVHWHVRVDIHAGGEIGICSRERASIDLKKSGSTKEKAGPLEKTRINIPRKIRKYKDVFNIKINNKTVLIFSDIVLRAIGDSQQHRQHENTCLLACMRDEVCSCVFSHENTHRRDKSTPTTTPTTADKGVVAHNPSLPPSGQQLALRRRRGGARLDVLFRSEVAPCPAPF